MDQWLDSLSEDWISQPRSSHSNSALNTSPVPSSLDHDSNVSKSRIPRYKPRSVSGSGGGVASLAEPRFSSTADTTNKAALHERSSSKLNSSQREGSTRLGKLDSSSSKSGPKSKRHTSTSSLPLAGQDTIQHKPLGQSPLKGSSPQATPEWRRRVLQGHIAPGDQCDLFSPISLEKVFKPPTLGAKMNPKRVARTKPAIDEYSLSPPPYPSRAGKPGNTGFSGVEQDKSSILSPINGIEEKDGIRKIPITKSSPCDIEVKKQIQTKGKTGTKKSFVLTQSPQSTQSAAKRLSNKPDPSKTRPSQKQTQLPSKPSVSQIKADSQVTTKPLIRARASSASSAQDEDRDEIISPLYVSRHHTVDGHIDYAALDVSMHQLHTQMDQLRVQQNNIPFSPSSDNEIDYTGIKSPEIHLSRTDENHNWTSHSLPEDLSTGTDAFAANGGFVSIRRGGYSDDGSFQRRPLSPSSLPASDNFQSKSSVSSSKHIIRDKKAKLPFQATPARPSPGLRTPQTQLTDKASSQEHVRSSGSPLKLFDKYDTFTNDRLSRRMSKFEEAIHQATDDENYTEDTGINSSPSIAPKKSTSKIDQRFQRHSSNDPHHGVKSRISSFGDGRLDGHNFPSYRPPLAEQDKAGEISPDLPKQNSGLFIFKQSSVSQPQLQDTEDINHSRGKAKALLQDLKHTRRNGDVEETCSRKPALALDRGKDKSPNDELRNAQGKRLPRSPAKNPQPKRRRTIGRPEAAHEDSQAEKAIEKKSPVIQSVVGRKRKDALYDGQSQAADPKILAMRQMLRPRSSTHNQNVPQDRNLYEGLVAETKDKNVYAGELEQFKPINIDHPTQELAEELATFTLDMVQDITCGSRKASVTTADFFNEAQQIMQLIRAQGRPQINHSVIEESETDLQESANHTFDEESTKDEFLRPPSREGASLRRLREPLPVDARVMSHLKKYEDKDDFGMTLTSSLKSLQSKQSDRRSSPPVTGRQTTNFLESDPPNLRILDRNIEFSKHRNSSSLEDSPALTTDPKLQSLGSHPTSGPSTGRSLHTGSSRGSANRVVIAPQTVSHLLSDQIAGMTFDHERQVWVKQRNTSNAAGLAVQIHSNSDMTDEDLLGEIPDLSVDELEEMQRIKEAVASFKNIGSSSNGIANHDYAKPIKTQEMESQGRGGEQDNRPRTAEGTALATNDDSSAPSKYSRFASSGPIIETRATSWGDDMFPGKIPEAVVVDSPGSLVDYQTEHEEEVEHEISILEGRLSRTPTRPSHRDRQARVVTVAFSSPLIDQIQTPYIPSSGIEKWDEETGLDLDDSPIRFDSRPDMSAGRRCSAHPGRRSSYRSASRRGSIGSQSYIARPMSRLDEQDEICFLQNPSGNSDARLDVVVSTPLSFQRSVIGPHFVSTDHGSSVAFHLSPLADFTVHQSDTPITDRPDLANRRGLLPQREAQSRFSLATQDLVKQLTDLAPYEPYWDFIRSIDLRNRGLVTLHMLGEFCRRIEELDVSDNSLDQLDGAPSSIRDLRVSQNQLSDLTAWGHLYNLQYLDVSHNKIRCLKGFQALFHLRELKADGNQIENIEGIFEHDGLISLSLRGNQVKSVDFEGCNLKRLTHLDMEGNKLVKVVGLHYLLALKHIDLSVNELENLDSFSLKQLPALQTFNVSSNRLVTLDVTHMLKLRTLNLDKNSIGCIQGLHRLKDLETLSWREQDRAPGSSLFELHYQDCHNIQHIYLSNNVLSSFAPSTTFLNLRNLEVASTSLKSLPSDFGHKLPNLRVLNLNFNALRDLRPLLGIVRLQKLFIAGNRISRLRQTATILERLNDQLMEVDLRRNPLTVGFYTPQEQFFKPEKRLVLQDRAHVDGSVEEAADVQAAKAYLLPHVDRETDAAARARLDKDTHLRRRVYEMMVVDACPVLRVLDGMEVDRKAVGCRDGVMERLMELGVLMGREGDMEERGRDRRKKSRDGGVVGRLGAGDRDV